MTLVSVIVINYKGLGDIPGCLESIRYQEYKDIELLIIDNHSDDGSLELIKEYLDDPGFAGRFAGRHLLIENESNLGFSPALNQGIAESGGDLVMPLNTDIVLEPGFIARLVERMSEPGVGSATGKLMRFPPGGADNIIDSAGHVIFKNRLAENRGEGEPGRSAYPSPEEVFGTCGAAAMYKRRMLEDVEVQGEVFDEDFFAFWEDLDLDWRARLRGWRCVYEPDAVGYHRRGGAGYRKSLLVEYHNYKNRYLMMVKNDSAAFVLRNLPGIILTESLKGGALLFRCPGALAALVEVVRLIPRMLAKRKVIQSRRIVPAREIEVWFLPFPYIKWIKRHLFNRGELIVESREAMR